jgi:hypothetical protein
MMTPLRGGLAAAALALTVMAGCADGLQLPFLPQADTGKATSDFVPRALSYLPADEPPLPQPFTMGVATMDLWGSVCEPPQRLPGDPAFACDDSRPYAASVMKRLRQIGSNLVLVTDFAHLYKDQTLRFNFDQRIGDHTLSQAELATVAKAAHDQGLQAMLITNIDDGEPGASAAADIEHADPPTITRLHQNWRQLIVSQARRAQEAGFDALVTNWRNLGQFFGARDADAALQWPTTFREVKQAFPGKLAFWHQPWYFKDRAIDWQDIAIAIIDNPIPYVMKGVPEELPAIEAAWKAEFAGYRAARARLGPDRQLYSLILMPSYDGAMQKGWIEPVARYPVDAYKPDWQEQALVYEGYFRAVARDRPPIDGVIAYNFWWTDRMPPATWMRVDLGHSIRGKDAETVFANWAGRAVGTAP